MQSVQNSFHDLDDPVELALCRYWMNGALKKYLNEQPLEGSIENWEYRDQYADGIVRYLWSFAQREKIVKNEAPVVELIDTCGWIVSKAGLYDLLVSGSFQELSREYSFWRQHAGTALHEKAHLAYCNGGDSALNQCLR